MYRPRAAEGWSIRVRVGVSEIAEGQRSAGGLPERLRPSEEDSRHGDAGTGQRAVERIDGKRKLLQRDCAEKRESRRRPEEADRVKGPAIDGQQNFRRHPFVLASVGERDRDPPLGGKTQPFQLRGGETGEHGAGIYEKFHLNSGFSPTGVGHQRGVCKRAHRIEL